MYSSTSASLTANSTPSSDFKSFTGIHKKLSSVLDEMREFAPEVYEEFENSEEDSDEDPLFGEGLTRLQEINILIREILQVQDDVKELYAYLQSKRSSDRQEVAKLRRQLHDLMEILVGQLTRAERLVKKYETM